MWCHAVGGSRRAQSARRKTKKEKGVSLLFFSPPVCLSVACLSCSSCPILPQLWEVMRHAPSQGSAPAGPSSSRPPEEWGRVGARGRGGGRGKEGGESASSLAWPRKGGGGNGNAMVGNNKAWQLHWVTKAHKALSFSQASQMCPKTRLGTSLPLLFICLLLLACFSSFSPPIEENAQD